MQEDGDHPPGVPVPLWRSLEGVTGQEHLPAAPRAAVRPLLGVLEGDPAGEAHVRGAVSHPATIRCCDSGPPWAFLSRSQAGSNPLLRAFPVLLFRVCPHSEPMTLHPLRRRPRTEGLRRCLASHQGIREEVHRRPEEPLQPPTRPALSLPATRQIVRRANRVPRPGGCPLTGDLDWRRVVPAGASETAMRVGRAATGLCPVGEDQFGHREQASEDPESLAVLRRTRQQRYGRTELW